MNEEQIDEIAQDTAEDILKRHAPDCLQRAGLRDAIARLARLGLESSFRLYLLQHRHEPEEISSRQSTHGGGLNGQPRDIGDKPGDTTPAVAEDAARPERKMNYVPIADTAVLDGAGSRRPADGCPAPVFLLGCHAMPADSVDSQRRSTGGGSAASQSAVGMLSLFASVDAERFDLTLTDSAGRKVAFRGDQTLDQLRISLPRILEVAARQLHNVIVRPRSSGPALIQLDDLDAAAEARLRPVSLLTIKTSPGSFQAWVAVVEADAGFARRLRKGAGADPSASGATRVSGSRNFKGKYTPDFPVVETIHACPGRIVTRSELEALGVVAPLERIESAPAPARASRRSGRHAWPIYQRCVEGAPDARDGGRPDISRADFTFCLLAIDWGWSADETAARLMQESSKAQENGEAYAQRTAESAAGALALRSGRGR